MSSSWERGRENISFTEQGCQAKEERTGNRENFIFNIVNKVLRTAQAKSKEIDLSLRLICDNKEDPKKCKAFQRLVSNIMFNQNNIKQIRQSLDKVYAFGQAVFHVKAVREDEKTLNHILAIENLPDPQTAFFDANSKSSNFNDGDYCGRCYLMGRSKLAKLYPRVPEFSLVSSSKGDDEDKIEVIDFWYKSSKKMEFMPLANGSYKRKDLINPLTDSLLKTESKFSSVTVINYVRVVKEGNKVLDKQMNLPLSRLPLIMNTGGCIWTGDQYETYPLGYHLRHTQVLLNYTGSVIGSILKSTNADRWLFSQQHVKSAASKRSATQINDVEGGMIFDGNIGEIRREVSQQVPPTLNEIFISLQQTLQNLSGAYADDSANLKAISGVALDKLFDRADLVQNPIIVAHIETIAEIGEIIKEMIPIYYRENRSITTYSSDNQVEVIEINKEVTMPNGMVVVENEINDITSNYEYRVVATVSSRLQKQNTQTELATLYQLYPDAIGRTIDIYARSLDISTADIIARRLGADIPQPLIAYGDNNLSIDQYRMQQQQLQGEQQQLAQQDPQYQYLQARAQKESAHAQSAIAKTQIDQYSAQTQRIKEIGTIHNTATKNTLEARRSAIDALIAQNEQQLEEQKTLFAHQNALLESLK